MKIIVIWGSQLSLDRSSALSEAPDAPVVMIESRKMSKAYPYHKQKLLFVLTAMREFADELRHAGRTVHYVKMEDSDDGWFTSLQNVCKRLKVTEVIAMRANDRTPQRRLEEWCRTEKIALSVTPNTLFLTSTGLFDQWADGNGPRKNGQPENAPRRLQMEMFYRWQRKRLNILMEENGKPTGGKWNYDSENREPLPKDIELPALPLPAESKHTTDVIKLIDTYFADHPGTYDDNWLPATRDGAAAWLDEFIKHRFAHFGKYEDAMKKGETFLFHSALSALINIGLLHASEVVDAAQKADVPLAAKEGFIRQIIGWREFMFGLYNYKPMSWKNDNFLKHTRKLEDWWWTLDETKAPEPPIADIFVRLKKYGYSHHIERLMVLGNYMLLAGYDPYECYRWFMSMYVDAYEWVMVPNVIGMSQYADGGQDNGGFATKPYISGSNYLQKMGSWWPSTKAAKESDWTPMYWDFLERHSDALRNNYRLRPLIATVERRKQG